MTYSHTYSATLAPGARLRYRISAINTDGTGDPSNVLEATVPDAPDTGMNGAPDRTGITINGNRFVITFDETLDNTVVLQEALFEIIIGEGEFRARARNMEVMGNMVVGTVSATVVSDDKVLIGYRLPRALEIGDAVVATANNALKDGEGNLVANWSAFFGVVTNETLPTAADGTVRTAPDTAYTFTADDFNAEDDSLTAVKIVTSPPMAEGALTLNGSDVSDGYSVPKADIDAGMLQYTPPAGQSGIPYTTFTFKVSDGVKESVGLHHVHRGRR